MTVTPARPHTRVHGMCAHGPLAYAHACCTAYPRRSGPVRAMSTYYLTGQLRSHNCSLPGTSEQLWTGPARTPYNNGGRGDSSPSWLGQDATWSCRGGASRAAGRVRIPKGPVVACCFSGMSFLQCTSTTMRRRQRGSAALRKRLRLLDADRVEGGWMLCRGCMVRSRGHVEVKRETAPCRA